MEAKELMIGDLVYLNSNSEDRKIYYQISCIHTGEIGIRGIGEHREVRIVTPPYIESIPLTEKIMKKNGFGINGESFRPPKQWNGESFLIYITEGECAISTNIYEESIFFLRYVHELQHLLRLFGMQELANNFKI